MKRRSILHQRIFQWLVCSAVVLTVDLLIAAVEMVKRTISDEEAPTALLAILVSSVGLLAYPSKLRESTAQFPPGSGGHTATTGGILGATPACQSGEEEVCVLGRPRTTNTTTPAITATPAITTTATFFHRALALLGSAASNTKAIDSSPSTTTNRHLAQVVCSQWNRGAATPRILYNLELHPRQLSGLWANSVRRRVA
jgi:hypothetical protein